MFRKGTTIVWADAEPATTAAVAAVPSSSSASSSMGAESASNSKGAVHAGPSPSLNSSGTPIHPLLDISRSSSVPGSPAPAKTAASTPFSNGKKNSATGKGAVKAAPTKTKRVLRTLYIDIIGDEFWTPASASEAAPASAPMSAAAVSASSSGRDRTGEEEDEERRKVQGDTDKEGEEQETEQEGITSEPWEDEQRLNGQGLGYGLLDD